MEEKFLYRYEFYRDIYVEEYKVIKETEKGYWILVYGVKKFVSKIGKKCFARTTKKEALIDFYYRKGRWLSMEEKRFDYAKYQFGLISNYLSETYGGIDKVNNLDIIPDDTITDNTSKNVDLLIR